MFERTAARLTLEVLVLLPALVVLVLPVGGVAPVLGLVASALLVLQLQLLQSGRHLGERLRRLAQVLVLCRKDGTYRKFSN